jgi:hypothetical protein
MINELPRHGPADLAEFGEGGVLAGGAGLVQRKAGEKGNEPNGRTTASHLEVKILEHQRANLYI